MNLSPVELSPGEQSSVELSPGEVESSEVVPGESLSLAESSEVDWTRAWSRAAQERGECRGTAGSGQVSGCCAQGVAASGVFSH